MRRKREEGGKVRDRQRQTSVAASKILPFLLLSFVFSFLLLSKKNLLAAAAHGKVGKQEHEQGNDHAGTAAVDRAADALVTGAAAAAVHIVRAPVADPQTLGNEREERAKKTRKKKGEERRRRRRRRRRRKDQ